MVSCWIELQLPPSLSARAPVKHGPCWGPRRKHLNVNRSSESLAETRTVEREKMQVCRGILLAVLLATFGSPARAQDRDLRSDDALTRNGRVVVVSPHFDEPLPVGGGLSCPAGPMHLYGFEGGEAEPAPPFLVRVFSYEPGRRHEYVVPADGRPIGPLAPIQAMVRMTHRIEEEAEIALPLEPAWAQIADSTGTANLAVAPGLYRIKVEHIGFRSGEGVVRVRGTHRDSLHAYLFTAPICEEE